MPGPSLHLVAQGAEEQLSGLGDAAADHDPMRADEDRQVRDRDAEHAAGAGDRLQRLRIPGPRGAERVREGLPTGCAGDRARAGDGLEAAVVAAAARLAVDDDGVVTDLARPVLHAQAELPAEHEPAAHAGSADDADHVLGAARSADPRLGERERVAVVEQRDRSAETLFEPRTHGEADPVAAEVGKEHGASVLVDEPGDRDADRVEGLGAAAELEHAANDGLRRSRLGARRDGASYKLQLVCRSRGARRRRAAPA